MTPHIRSVHRSAQFPAVPSPEAALLLALLHQLDASQWWPVARVRDAQLARLELLLDHAARSVPFYRDSLARCGLERGLTLEAWRRLPILRRIDVQRHARALRATQLPTGHQHVRAVSTSGSTGTSITVDTTECARLMWMAALLREHAWHGRDLMAKHVAIRIAGRG